MRCDAHAPSEATSLKRLGQQKAPGDSYMSDIDLVRMRLSLE